MEKTNAFAVGYFILMIAVLIAIAALFITGGIDLLLAVVLAVVVIIVFVAVAAFIGAGIFYAVKQKDKPHVGSDMSIGDLQEVDREMEKK